MKRLLFIILSLLPITAVSADPGPTQPMPTPPPTTQPRGLPGGDAQQTAPAPTAQVDWWATVRSRRANVRNMPTLKGSNILGHVDQGVNVELHGKYAEWYRVRPPKGPLAWMHQSTLTVAPDVAHAVPVMSVDLAMPGARPTAPAAPPTDPMLALHNASIVELPPSANQRPDALPVPIVVRACLGAEQINVCNEGAGIRGLLILVMDQATAQILGHTQTDARGVAQLAVPVAEGDTLVINAPTLGWTHTLQASGGRASIIPPIVERTLPLPWPLP